MADVLTPEQRRLNMSRIRGKDTKPEVILRKALHRSGYRYRLHVRSLPGTPDLVLQKYGAVVQVNGCFWHGHGCHLCKQPATRAEFWSNKIRKTQERDAAAIKSLQRLGWRVLVVWECALRGKKQIGVDNLVARCGLFLRGTRKAASVAGRTTSR